MRLARRQLRSFVASFRVSQFDTTRRVLGGHVLPLAQVCSAGQGGELDVASSDFRDSCNCSDSSGWW